MNFNSSKFIAILWVSTLSTAIWAIGQDPHACTNPLIGVKKARFRIQVSRYPAILERDPSQPPKSEIQTLLSGDTLSHPHLAAPADFSMGSALLKPPATTVDVADLGTEDGDVIGSHPELRHLRLVDGDDFPSDYPLQRILAIWGQYPLAKTLVKPGHIVARNPRTIEGLKNAFTSNLSLVARDERDNRLKAGSIEVDLIYSSQGVPQRIEVRDGHHRVMGLVLANPNVTFGWFANLLGDSLQILENGVPLGQQSVEINKVALHGLPISLFGNVGLHSSQKAATVKLKANNWELGSRTSSLFAARASTGVYADDRKVGVYFLKGSEANIQGTLNDLAILTEFESIVLIPAPGTPVDGLNRLIPRVSNLDRLNLYLPDTSREDAWEGNFREDIFIKRIQQLYVNPDVSKITL